MIDENDLKGLVKECPVAEGLFQQHGCHDVMTAFNIANHLHMHGFLKESAVFYQEAIDYRKDDPEGHPREEILLQVKLLCLVKAGAELEDSDLNRLQVLSEPLYHYIVGVQQHRQGNLSIIETLQKIGYTYEQFHTGEEIDTIYLRLIYEGLSKGNFPNKIRKTEIPRNLFFFWDRNMPDDVRQNIEHHQQFKNYNVEVFDQDRAIEWLYKYYGKEAKTIFLKSRHPAEAADILRVHVINLYGGFWVDADLKITSEELLEKYIPRNYDNVLLLTDGYFVHNDFFAATANNIILKDCLLSIYRNCYEYGGLFISYKTGPGVFMRAINRAYFRCMDGAVKEMPSLKLMDQKMFDKITEQYPVAYKQGGTWTST
ncbi:capsular polysaccharide synthesis protein [Commensalibacter oyaizuii]|uniref:Capsular polysaccharide synthesis protein n=1 Tax=Commensalibacter oyaizuii TaxID=3043873 RepID=A0ABT6Q310_9PROT|nr:capsular polysaccharide synthesis protein [Commensalibacter sp. TBRC 16381]MDI2091485.1 capsular polysaccharide synthesis protein [Commensalibacter sp. TBRC 16381]